MPPPGRTFRVACAWLLAFLTPASGLPHRQCVCPDGGVKWFCLRPADDTGCCCGSACCVAGGAAADAPPPAAPCCCCRHHDRGPADGLRETPCRKSWQPSSVVADRRAREPGLVTIPQAPSHLADIPADPAFVPEGVCEPVRQSNRAPPPSDRNLLFQRFLL
jgi:hypothetical protein